MDPASHSMRIGPQRKYSKRKHSKKQTQDLPAHLRTLHRVGTKSLLLLTKDRAVMWPNKNVKGLEKNPWWGNIKITMHNRMWSGKYYSDCIWEVEHIKYSESSMHSRIKASKENLNVHLEDISWGQVQSHVGMELKMWWLGHIKKTIKKPWWQESNLE